MSESKQAGDLKASATLVDLSFPAGREVRPPGPRAGDKKLQISRKKPRRRFRGVPPPPTFDIDKLANSTRLDETETAAMLRRSKACLENWRKDPDHPLKWRLVGGRILYEVGTIRDFLNG